MSISSKKFSLAVMGIMVSISIIGCGVKRKAVKREEKAIQQKELSKEVQAKAIKGENFPEDMTTLKEKYIKPTGRLVSIFQNI